MTGSVSYQQQRIRCGKKNCHCNTTDAREWHGPYWYGYWTDPTTGKTRSKYIGKNFDPPHARQHTTYSDRRAGEQQQRQHTGRDARERAARAERDTRQRAESHARERSERDARERAEREARHARERMRNRRPTDEADAACIGVDVGVTREDLKRAWRQKMQKHHPDRYPEPERARQEEIAKNINSAYQRMLKRRGWQ